MRNKKTSHPRSSMGNSFTVTEKTPLSLKCSHKGCTNDYTHLSNFNGDDINNPRLTCKEHQAPGASEEFSNPPKCNGPCPVSDNNKCTWIVQRSSVGMLKCGELNVMCDKCCEQFAIGEKVGCEHGRNGDDDEKIKLVCEFKRCSKDAAFIIKGTSFYVCAEHRDVSAWDFVPCNQGLCAMAGCAKKGVKSVQSVKLCDYHAKPWDSVVNNNNA